MFKNTMKTTVLLAAMGGLIVAVAGLIGGGSTASLTIGLGLALVMVGGSYWFSDKLALASAKAHVIQREEAPEFYDIVASLASRAVADILLRSSCTQHRGLSRIFRYQAGWLS